MKKVISVVVPVYNEAKNVPLLHQAVQKAFAKTNYEFQLLFVDDGSTDASVMRAEELARQHRNVTLLRLTRNFGKEIALSAGLHHAKGAAVAMLDADLQHPPELLPKFIEKWEAGADVVVGVKKVDGKESFIKRFFSRLFYRLMNAISETKIIPHATDYRLVDRQVMETFCRFTERSRITRGLFDWLGFEQEVIYFDAPRRQHGSPGYSYRKLVQLAMDSFVGFSLLPLRFAGYLGAGIMVIAALLGAFIIVEDLILGDPLQLQITGTAMLAVLILFLVGVILSALGLIALYIARIHTEVTNRPLYIVHRPRPRERAKK